MTSQHQTPTNLIFVVEGTALSGGYLHELKQHYIIPTLEYFAGPIDEKDCGSDSNYCLFGLVVFHAADILPGFLTEAHGPLTTSYELLSQLDRVQFAGGHGEAAAHVGEGLATALHCLQDFPKFRNIPPDSPEPKKHIVLVCNCKPYGLPIMESIGSDGSFKGQTAEQIANGMSEKGVHLSIIAPRKIPALITLFDRAGGDMHIQKGYARDPRHLVLLNGFQLQVQERPSTPQQPKALEAPNIPSLPVSVAAPATSVQTTHAPTPMAVSTSVPIPISTVPPATIAPQVRPQAPPQVPNIPIPAPAPTTLVQSLQQGIPSIPMPHAQQPGGPPSTQLPQQPPMPQMPPSQIPFRNPRPIQPPRAMLNQQLVSQLAQQQQQQHLNQQQLAQQQHNQQQLTQQQQQLNQQQLTQQQLNQQQQLNLNQQLNPQQQQMNHPQLSQQQLNQQQLNQQQLNQHLNQQQLSQQAQLNQQQQLNKQLHPNQQGQLQMQQGPQPGPGQQMPMQQMVAQQLGQAHLAQQQQPQQLNQSQVHQQQQASLQQQMLNQQNQQHQMLGQQNQQQQMLNQQMMNQQNQQMLNQQQQQQLLQKQQQQQQQQQPWSSQLAQQAMQQQQMGIPSSTGPQPPQLQPTNPPQLPTQRAPEIVRVLNQPPIAQSQSPPTPMGLPQLQTQQPNIQKERRNIWSGLLEWHEKLKGPPEGQKVPRQVPCQVSANVINNEPEVTGEGWPAKLIMQLIPKAIVGNLGGGYFMDVKTVLFMLQQCEALASLTRVMESGFAGCVHFTGSGACQIKVLILLYSKERCAYLGFIPNDQVGFVDRIRKVIQQQKTQQASMRQGGGAAFPQAGTGMSPRMMGMGGQQLLSQQLQQPPHQLAPGQQQARQQLQPGQQQQQLPPGQQMQAAQQQLQQPLGQQPTQLQQMQSIIPQPPQGMAPQSTDLDPRELERQRNVLEIQELQRQLQAARQRELELQQLQSSQGQMSQQGQMGNPQNPMQGQQMGMGQQQQTPGQQQMGFSGLQQQRQQLLQQQRGQRPTTMQQTNPGLKSLLQQQSNVGPQFRPGGPMTRMAGMHPQQQGQPSQDQQGGQQMPAQPYDDVRILDLLR